MYSIKTNIILYLPFIFIKYKNNILLPFTNKNYFNYFILNNIFLINANIISYITRFLINKEMFDNSYYIFDSFINIYCKLNHNFILLNNCSNESINEKYFTLIFLYQLYLMCFEKNNSNIKLYDLILFNILN